MEFIVNKVREIIRDEGFNALIVSSIYNIRYITGFDGFQTEDREGYVLVTSSNIYLFASTLTAEGARQKVKNAEIIELSAQNRLLPSLQGIIDKENIKKIGFEKNLTYTEFKHFKKLKNVKLSISQDIVEDVRIIKSLDEIEKISKACKLTDNCYSHILKNIRIGKTEKELGWEIEKYIKENGGELAFPSIVAFGENSAIPHHKSTSDKLRANSIILLDFGAKVDGYCADMTRTVFFGKAPDKFRNIYNTVLGAQKKSLDLKTSSLTPEVIDETSRDFIIERGYPSIPHSVGHGVGLEVHELPHITPGEKQTLENNTVFTVEPGIYVNDFGGVRIEDTVFFNGEEIISLTNSSKNLVELS